MDTALESTDGEKIAYYFTYSSKPTGAFYTRLFTVTERESDVRTKQQQNFNSRHRSRQLVELYPGDSVYVNDGTISVECNKLPQDHIK